MSPEESASAAPDPGPPSVSDPGKRRPGHRLALSFLASTLIPLLAYSAFVAGRFWTAPEWEFSIAAQSDIVSMVLADEGETRWRVDGAVVCTRPAPAETEGLLRLDAAAFCGNARWTASRISSPETVLRLLGGVQVRMERRSDSGLALSVRTADGESLAGVLESSDGRIQLPLPRRTNLVWLPITADEPGSARARDPEIGELVFPFTGQTTIGRDVGWSDARLLQQGTIAVYTADDSADERRKVDEAELMLGDQVRIGFVDPTNEPTSSTRSRASHPAKGFVRWDPDEGTALDVVAFGRASGLAIDRFGESGYGFAPSILIRILNDPIVIVLGVLLMSWINLFSIFQPLIGVPGVLDGGENPPRGRRRIVQGLLKRIIGRFRRRAG